MMKYFLTFLLLVGFVDPSVAQESQPRFAKYMVGVSIGCVAGLAATGAVLKAFDNNDNSIDGLPILLGVGLGLGSNLGAISVADNPSTVAKRNLLYTVLPLAALAAVDYGGSKYTIFLMCVPVITMITAHKVDLHFWRLAKQQGHQLSFYPETADRPVKFKSYSQVPKAKILVRVPLLTVNW